jgi:4-hydroxybenzoate polyprenyltransferase
MPQTAFQCYRCKRWAERSPENAKLDDDECTCERPLHPGVVYARQREAVINAVAFGALAFFVLWLLHVPGPSFWCIILAVVVIAYVFYSWLFGRQLRRERPKR